MPLRAVHDAGSIQSFELSGERWQELKSTYKALCLRMPCCGEPAIPKTSPLGTFFFAHQRKGDCTTAPESVEHIFCKNVIAQAAQAAGWEVTTEFAGASPDGEEWVADVYCTKGNAKIALEVQISPQTADETNRRQERYRASGIRCAWFFGPKGLSGAKESYFGERTPAFVLRDIELGQVPEMASFTTSLRNFVTALLRKRVVWHVDLDTIVHLIEYVDDTCYQCKRPIKQIYGHGVEGYEDFQPRAYTPSTLSTALEVIQQWFTNDELLALGLNRIGMIKHIKGKPALWPYVNVCRHCGVPQSNHFLSKRMGEAMRSTSRPDSADFDYEPPSVGPFGAERIPRQEKGRAYWKLLDKE